MTNPDFYGFIKYNQQIETFPEECKNCIFAWGNREMPGDAGRCGGAEIQFPHSGAAVKPYPGETFRSTDNWQSGQQEAEKSY
jgi:hypothetical protein